LGKIWWICCNFLEQDVNLTMLTLRSHNKQYCSWILPPEYYPQIGTIFHQCIDFMFDQWETTLSPLYIEHSLMYETTVNQINWNFRKSEMATIVGEFWLDHNQV
jgi:hypothetical protein